ncbi:MAG: Na(+)-translocating NADH-quinone reductase subunit A [Saprospiraceae bacterium]|nr:MAG: Na(+)-translocating NADH-quinone reductase subunit A [Saprospiraceae bacterium]
MLSVLVLMFSATGLFAQAGGGSSYFIYALVGAAVLIFFYLILQVSDNLLAIEAKQNGIEDMETNFSILPGIKDIFSAKLPDYTKGAPVKVLKRGHDILLEGEATKTVQEVQVSNYAVQPINFRGIAPIPKMLVEEGATVKAGDPLFFDKSNPDIKFVAPVSGELIAINRGAKRAITEVVILADKTIEYRELPTFDLEKNDRKALVDYLLGSGIWPLIRQRPYDCIPNPDDVPRDIFISTFDSAPLAPDLNFIIKGKEVAFQKGLDVLAKLTDGAVHLGLNARGEEAPSTAFTQAENVKKYWYHGKHPAGNVGIQIHNSNPINAGDKVWVLGIQEVVTLGNIFLEKRFNAQRTVALTGDELQTPTYINTYLGANIGDLLKDNLKEGNNRLISGDVLSGQQKASEGYLNAFDDQITVAEEGDYFEMFGWLLPLAPRPSISNTFPNFLFPKLKFHADTNTHGEKRAFVITGQYEKVLPMDIYPQALMKSIIIGDFEKMEGLGIYELSEEDVALCEFVCTSKQPLQHILREGLEMMQAQG